MSEPHTHETPAHETQAHEPGTSWRWPLIVVGFLGFNVLTQGVLLAFALHDPGFRLEPDYYQHAVAWDDERAEEARASAQGWRLALQVQPASGGASVVGRLEEAGRPLAGAEVRVVAFHPAHGDQTFQARLTEAGEPGVYGALLPLRRAGRWVVRVEARRGASALRQELRVELPGTGS